MGAVASDFFSLPEAVQEQQYDLIVVPYNTLLHFREHEIAQILRQVARLDQTAAAEHERMLDNIFQLPYITWPVIGF